MHNLFKTYNVQFGSCNILRIFFDNLNYDANDLWWKSERRIVPARLENAQQVLWISILLGTPAKTSRKVKGCGDVI